MNSQPKNPPLSPPFDLVSERLGPLPLVNHFIEQLGLEETFERFVPTLDGRCRLPYAKGLGVLVRSIIVEREPIYRHQDVLDGFAPGLFGISARQVKNLKDDQLGRALDHLWLFQRSSTGLETVDLHPHHQRRWRYSGSVSLRQWKHQ